MKWQETAVRISILLVVVWSVNLLISWGINRYFGTPTPVATAVQSGQQVRVIPAERMQLPLKTEIDFIDTDTSRTQAMTDASAADVALRLSTAGASIEELGFVRNIAGTQTALMTIAPSTVADREDRAFLVALDAMTPFTYTLVDSKKTPDGQGQQLTYQTETSQVRITKQFTAHPKSYLIDVAVTVEPLVPGTPIQPRFFFPGPRRPDDKEREGVTGVALDERQSLQKIAQGKLFDVAWAMPRIFGAQDKYFAHLLVKDPQNFVQRAYYKDDSRGGITAILEGPAVAAKTTWNMTFYCGPKEAEPLNAVDPRLEKLLDYGWFGFFAKLILWLLKFFNRYVNNYGLAIILLTLIIRLLMLPLTLRADQSMQKQREVSKKMKYLEQKYADDPAALQQAKYELIKQNGILPGGMGCLSYIVQIPIFIGLSYALRSSIELYRAPFGLWIHDLSIPDPWYVLPVLIGVSMFMVSSKTAQDPKQKVMGLIMALIIGGLMMKLSAGLALFIAVNSLFGVVQAKLGTMLKKVRFS